MPNPSKVQSILHSFRSLPTWVQLWVGLLIIVNSGWVALLDTPTGMATAIAAAVVMLTNGPLTYYYGGMNRALSIPHLLAWIPLQAYLIHHLYQQQGIAIAPVEYAYGVSVLVVNGISLIFDVIDSWRWLAGERATPGLNA